MALVVSLASLTALAPVAGASVRVGAPNLDGPLGASNCGVPPPCTFANTAIPGSVVTSPVNGTVTGWGVRTVGMATTARFRITDPIGSGALFLRSSNQLVTPAGPHTFTSALPISIGDGIAVDVFGVDPAGINGINVAGGGWQVWQTVPLDGATATPNDAGGGSYFHLFADVEPTSAFSVASVTSTKKGTATLTVALPNPGVLTATGAIVEAATLNAAGPGDATLTLRPAKAAKKRLKKKGKASGAVSLSFTPTFGTAAAGSAQVKLKKKKTKKRKG